MIPAPFHACLLACALALAPLCAAPAAEGGDQAQPGEPPVADQEWKAFLADVAKSQVMAFARSVDPQDAAVKKAIASWETELKCKIDLARGDFLDLLTSSGHWDSYAAIGIPGEGGKVRLLTAADGVYRLVAGTESFLVPSSRLAALRAPIIDFMWIHDALRDRLDLAVDNLALPDLIDQVCTQAQVDFVTRRDLGKDLLVTLHLTGKTRLACLDSAANACDWVVEESPGIAKNGFGPRLDAHADDYLDPWNVAAAFHSRSESVPALESLHQAMVISAAILRDRMLRVLPRQRAP